MAAKRKVPVAICLVGRMAEAVAPCHSTVTEKGRVRIQGRDCSGRGSEIISKGVCSSPLSQSQAAENTDTPQSPRPEACGTTKRSACFQAACVQARVFSNT